MANVTPSIKDYKEPLETMVCNTNNRDCMLQSCDQCPGTVALKEKLEPYLMIMKKKHIKFKQWKNDQNKIDLLSCELSIEEFIEEVTAHFDTLRVHHFIAKSKSNFLKDLKEKLKENELIILLDFAENYSFIVQNGVQGYHWNNSQVKLHPIVVYYKKSGILCSKSYCLISDCLNHDTNVVHKFMSVVLNDIRAKRPNATKCIYFSDGAFSQYKNCKNFINLRHHNSDHGLEAEWNFFATSHGKSQCDGIGGTVKRLTARVGLQMTSGQ